jgi:hypothetical protein
MTAAQVLAADYHRRRLQFTVSALWADLGPEDRATLLRAAALLFGSGVSLEEFVAYALGFVDVADPEDVAAGLKRERAENRRQSEAERISAGLKRAASGKAEREAAEAAYREQLAESEARLRPTLDAIWARWGKAAHPDAAIRNGEV